MYRTGPAGFVVKLIRLSNENADLRTDTDTEQINIPTTPEG